MPKRDAMRERARRELAKKEHQEEREHRETKDKSQETTPTFMSGFVIIFLSSLTFFVFYALGLGLIGFIGSIIFALIGMQRIYRASAARAKPENLSSLN